MDYISWFLMLISETIFYCSLGGDAMLGTDTAKEIIEEFRGERPVLVYGDP